jgi:hypothetical protein
MSEQHKQTNDLRFVTLDLTISTFNFSQMTYKIPFLIHREHPAYPTKCQTDSVFWHQTAIHRARNVQTGGVYSEKIILIFQMQDKTKIKTHLYKIWV